MESSCLSQRLLLCFGPRRRLRSRNGSQSLPVGIGRESGGVRGRRGLRVETTTRYPSMMPGSRSLDDMSAGNKGDRHDHALPILCRHAFRGTLFNRWRRSHGSKTGGGEEGRWGRGRREIPPDQTPLGGSARMRPPRRKIKKRLALPGDLCHIPDDALAGSRRLTFLGLRSVLKAGITHRFSK